jgi:hypothetical protein
MRRNEVNKKKKIKMFKSQEKHKIKYKIKSRLSAVQILKRQYKPYRECQYYEKQKKQVFLKNLLVFSDKYYAHNSRDLNARREQYRNTI